MISQGNSSGSIAIRQGVCVCYSGSGSVWIPLNRTHWSSGELASEATPESSMDYYINVKPRGWGAELILTFSKSRRQLTHLQTTLKVKVNHFL